MNKIFTTDNGWTGLVTRVALGVVMLPHGAQKLLGWFGGQGFSQTVATFTSMMHLPAVAAVLVILLESFGALGLIVGCLTRVAAFGFLCEMIGAIVMVHQRNGFFMNWTGQQAGEGYEYHLLVIGISLALLIAGAGRCSIDRAIAIRFPARRP
jgi:putative oxidoreductase